MSQQRTDIVYKLALCPRFDSWWHHNVKESFLGVTLFFVFILSITFVMFFQKNQCFA